MLISIPSSVYTHNFRTRLTNLRKTTGARLLLSAQRTYLLTQYRPLSYSLLSEDSLDRMMHNLYHLCGPSLTSLLW